jgi:hypothetical protein
VAAQARLWLELQADLAELVPGRREVVAERSGHSIHQSQLELVVDAIRQVVGAARQQSAGPAPRTNTTGMSTPAQVPATGCHAG